MRLDFYEVVKIVAEGERQNQLGVIRGVSEDKGVVLGYAVAFGSKAVFFKAEEIEQTGTRISEEDYFSGSWVGRLSDMVSE